jgi:hypothetical protein
MTSPPNTGQSRSKIAVVGAGLAIFLLSGLGLSLAQEVSLKGNVHQIDAAALTLEKGMQAAAQEFRKKNRDGLYFTGYVFTSMNTVHMGGKNEVISPYSVNARAGEIRIRRISQEKHRNGYSMFTDSDAPGPAGVFLLHQVSQGKSRIIDTQIFDPDRGYEFEDIPVFWLGKARNDESLSFLEDSFKEGPPELRKKMIFVLSVHDSPRVDVFLKGVALGDYSTEVRKNAIFWIGNRPEGFRSLKEISGKVQGVELKKHVVFAYSISKDEGAIKEMIRIARSEDDREVRKSAIFWLGNKASNEAVKLLKDVVDGSDEDADVKKSAVFAISQLPKEKSVPMLISIAKTNSSAAVRRNAIFWLGQTGDEKALEFFEEILLKK